MDAGSDLLYFSAPVPSHSTTRSQYPRLHSRSSSITSIDTIESSRSRPTTPSEDTTPSSYRFDGGMDTLAKETMGLPIFISHSTGEAVLSGNEDTAVPNVSASSRADIDESTQPSRRFSDMVVMALTSLENILNKSEELIIKSANMLLEGSDEEEAAQQQSDLESGRRPSMTCNAIRDKDGWVEGWLD